MGEMSEADRRRFGQAVRQAVRQVLREEFGEVMLDTLAAKIASDSEEDVGRGEPVQGAITCGACEHWWPDGFCTVFHTSRYFPKNETGFGLCRRLEKHGPREVGSFRSLKDSPKDSVIVFDHTILFGRSFGCIHGESK